VHLDTKCFSHGKLQPAAYVEQTTAPGKVVAFESAGQMSTAKVTEEIVTA
jgi:hypothetical protein